MMPLVSVITPSIRPDMLQRTIKMFHSQDYPNKELIIISGDGPVGAKRNKCCADAQGEIIAHFDDDDFYTPDYLSKSVDYLLRNNLDVTGMASAYFYDSRTGNCWDWTYHDEKKAMPYVCEATMVYRKSVWERRKFREVSVGEGIYFLAHLPKKEAHSYKDIFVANIHGGNIASGSQLHTMKKTSPANAINIINLCHY